MLALYQSGDDLAKVQAAVFSMAAQGLRVFAASALPKDFRAAKTVVFRGDTFEEVR